MKSAIYLENVVKDFVTGWRRTRKHAVRDVSLDVVEGETFGFIGPNGAGKSTIIKILTGILEPTSGRAEIFGISAGNSAARKGLGYVPENPYLFDYLTPMEILVMGMRLHDVRVSNERAHCSNWLERFELGRVATTPIRSFSKGMTQRVALAQALCINPRLLILDEPLSGLDPVGRKDVVDLLAEYKKSGTLFFTSHVLHDVERLADRFGLIHQGVMTAVQSPAEFVNADDVLSIRTLGLVPVSGMTEEFPGRWYGDVLRSELWATLNSLQLKGHSIVEVRPALSLESAFLKAVGRQQIVG